MNMSPTPSTPTPTTNGIPTVKSNGVSKAGSKVSSTSGSMTGVLSPSPNVSVTSTGKRVAGSRGVNNHVNNNRVKELAGQQGQGQGQGLGVNFTCKTNKDGKEINLQGGKLLTVSNLLLIVGLENGWLILSLLYISRTKKYHACL